MIGKIKFIASDMDGTLLDGKKKLPNDFYEVFDALHEKGIFFAAASGRQYFSLLKTFEPVTDKMIFIAENGTFVMYKGEELYSSVIPTHEIHTIIKSIKQIENSHIVLCGKKSAYIDTNDDKALTEIKHYYHQVEQVTDLLAVKDEFIKIAVLNFEGTETNVFPIAEKLFAKSHQVVVSAQIWLDFMNKEASKGTAIKHLQQLFGFSFEQSMSFGDYFNDVEMLKETYHSYTMENAHSDIKKLARFSAPSNDNQGVTAVIKAKVLD